MIPISNLYGGFLEKGYPEFSSISNHFGYPHDYAGPHFSNQINYQPC